MTHDFIRTIVRNELKRIRKYGGQIDRRHLKQETRISGQQLEAMISDCALELIAEESTVARRK